MTDPEARTGSRVSELGAGKTHSKAGCEQTTTGERSARKEYAGLPGGGLRQVVKGLKACLSSNHREATPWEENQASLDEKT